MTPDRLAEFIAAKLRALEPPALPQRGSDPLSLCDWINRFAAGQAAPIPSSALGPLWPQLPRLNANHYSLAQAPRQPILHTEGCGPAIYCNSAGRNGWDQPLPALEHCQQIAAHVIASNGEVAFARTDFTLPGPVPFHWRRCYRQSLAEDGARGGWRHSLDEHLQLDQGSDGGQARAWLHSADGRRIAFALPPIGHHSYNRFERLLLHRQSLHSFRLLGFDSAIHVFRADGTGQSLPLTEIRDNLGNILTVDYRQGRPARLVSSWGRAIEFEYEGERLTRILDRQAPAGAQLLCEYEYSEEEGRAQLCGARSAATTEDYRYSGGQLIGIGGRDGNSLSFTSDARGRCQQITVNGLEHRLRRIRSQHLCLLDVPGRDTLQWKFNHRGQLLQQQQGDSQIRFFHDHYGNLCQVTGADGRREIFRRDEFGRLLRRTCDGSSDRYLYNDHGLLIAAQRRGAQNWHFLYNAQGLLQTITDPAGHRWQCSYDERGLLEELRDPEGGRVALHWNGQAQLQAITRGARRWAFGYDHWNRLGELEIDGETQRRWHYGEAGELLRTGFGAGAETEIQIDHDSHRRPCRLRRGEQNHLQWQRDAADQIRAVTFADGRQWHLDHENGRPAQLHTESGVFHWQYDRHNRVVAFSGPGDFHRQWRYHRNGQIGEYRDGDTHWYLNYNSAGQVHQLRNNSGQQCQFHYDPCGRLIQADNEHSHLRFQYDIRGLLQAEHCDLNDGNQLSVNHRYDSRGWLKRSSSDQLDISCLLAPEGDLYGLDANGETLLRCERDNEGGSAQQIWHQGGARSHLTYQNGRLSALSIDAGPHWEFAPDKTQDAYLPAAPPHPHAIQWDKRGNVARELRPGTRQREYLYHYDGWGLLGSAECGDFKTRFRYDPFGRRLAKTTTHRRSRRLRQLFTHWTSLGLWSESTRLNNSETTVLHYLHHPLQGTPVARLRGEAREHFVTGANGAPVALLDDTGNPLWPRDATAQTAPASQGPGNYRGSEGLFDGETGLRCQPQGYFFGRARLTQPLDIPPEKTAGEPQRNNGGAQRQTAAAAGVTKNATTNQASTREHPATAAE